MSDTPSMSGAPRTTSSTAEPAARTLSFRWGELLAAPPAFINDLMVDLAEALIEAKAAGDKTRAECLDAVLDALAEGIVKHQRPDADDLDERTLRRAIGEIRAHYHQKSGRPTAGNWEAEALSLS